MVRECALEAPAVCWLFPGKTILIEALCLDCGEPLSVSVRAGVIEREDPPGLHGYTDLPFRKWRNNWPYA